MKVLIVSETDLAGGAGIAAFRLCQSLRSVGIESTMLVQRKISNEAFVMQSSESSFFMRKLRGIFKRLFRYLHKTQNVDTKILHSGNWVGSNILKYINESDAEVVNLHWINNEFLSLRQISKINKKVIWTLHDMWLFCGAEHYSFSKVFETNYLKASFINRIVWKRKRKYLKKTFAISPSDWLANCARSSYLLNDWPVFVIPNTLDLSLYRPLEKKMCRELLGLPTDKFICGFGAMGKNPPPYKGADLLKSTFKLLDKNIKENALFVDFGSVVDNEEVKTLHFGHISDLRLLPIFYNCLDVMLIPSRLDAFNQVASESQACGVPVVSFQGTGVADVVDHKVTGYLAEYINAEDFAEGILWIYHNSEKYKLSKNARTRAETFWDYGVVGNKYKEVFEELIGNNI